MKFRDCHRTFLSFKPPSLLVSQIAPTAASFAGRPRLLLPGKTCFVASARTGYAIRPFQAIDGERTFTFLELRSCRLLQGSGRSFLSGGCVGRRHLKSQDGTDRPSSAPIWSANPTAATLFFKRALTRYIGITEVLCAAPEEREMQMLETGSRCAESQK